MAGREGARFESGAESGRFLAKNPCPEALCHCLLARADASESYSAPGRASSGTLPTGDCLADAIPRDNFLIQVDAKPGFFGNGNVAVNYRKALPRQSLSQRSLFDAVGPRGSGARQRC